MEPGPARTGRTTETESVVRSVPSASPHEHVSGGGWRRGRARLDRPGKDLRQSLALFVWGRKVLYFPLAAIRPLKALLPRPEVRPCDAGHLGLQTHGVEIGAAVRSLLARVL